LQKFFRPQNTFSGIPFAFSLGKTEWKPPGMNHSSRLRPAEVVAMPRKSVKKEVRMKIAVPLFKERVAPYFGASSKILLVEMQGDAIAHEATWDVGGEGAMEIARRLVDLGVEKLICGGIQNRYKNWLVGRGVAVVENQRGTARDLVLRLIPPKEALSKETPCLPASGVVLRGPNEKVRK
jgi:predicted Fe-Mo cluster-binding NifX family protein